MPIVDYLPVAAAPGANAETQAEFAGSGHQVTGFTAGQAISKQLNKCWRQSSMMAAAIANFIANQLGIDVLDNGNRPDLTTNFTNAVLALAAGSIAPSVTVVAFSATPVFTVPAKPIVNFQITLTGDVTSSTLPGFTPGQIINFIVKQDGAGGHNFVFPPQVPAATIDAGVNAVSVQSFLVDSVSIIRPLTPMTVS